MDKIRCEFKQTITIFSIVLLLTTSCTSIRLISDYDEITDKKVTELQDVCAQHFVRLDRSIGTDGSKYVNFIQFYDDAKAELSTLRIRANAVDKNEIVKNMLIFLDKNISDLESLHKIGFKKKEELVPIRNAFESAFTAIIKFQMGLKARKKE